MGGVEGVGGWGGDNYAHQDLRHACSVFRFPDICQCV